jgi:hypothetical protein
MKTSRRLRDFFPDPERIPRESIYLSNTSKPKKNSGVYHAERGFSQRSSFFIFMRSSRAAEL